MKNLELKSLTEKEMKETNGGVFGILKEYDAPIKSCKKINSFYYSKPFLLEIKYSLKIILDEENKEIFGGNNFRPTLLDGSMFTLQYQNSSRETTLYNN